MHGRHLNPNLDAKPPWMDLLLVTIAILWRFHDEKKVEMVISKDEQKSNDVTILQIGQL